jgi:hypothetical protein
VLDAPPSAILELWLAQKRTKSAKGNHNSKIAEEEHQSVTVTPDNVRTKSGPSAVAGV